MTEELIESQETVKPKRATPRYFLILADSHTMHVFNTRTETNVFLKDVEQSQIVALVKGHLVTCKIESVLKC